MFFVQPKLGFIINKGIKKSGDEVFKGSLRPGRVMVRTTKPPEGKVRFIPIYKCLCVIKVVYNVVKSLKMKLVFYNY